MKIEPMTKERLDGVAGLESECFSHPLSRETLSYELDEERNFFLVATENEAVIGYIGAEIVLDEGYIHNVAVTAACRCKGVGTALINELVTYAKKNNLCFLTLEVRESNIPARSLYSKLGFIKVGERKNYYSNPTEPAVLMTRYFV